MYMEEDKQVPLLLGRHFQAIGVSLIDVKKGELTLKVGDEAVHFNLNKSLKQSECESTNCKTVETIVSISLELIFYCNFLSRRNEMPLQGILVVHIFYVWGTNFIGPFPSSFGNLYILLPVDYVSKWVEAISCPKNDASIVVGFIQRNILSRFRAPKTIISDEGSHFSNKVISKLMSRYGIRHVMGLAYRSQSNG